MVAAGAFGGAATIRIRRTGLPCARAGAAAITLASDRAPGTVVDAERDNRALRCGGERCPLGKFQCGGTGGFESAIVCAGLDRPFRRRKGGFGRGCWPGRWLGICRRWLGFLVAGGDKNHCTKDQGSAAKHGGFLLY